MALVIPEHYDPVLSVRETQEAIKFIRDLFQKEFGRQMNLERVSAPLFVTEKSGLNDNLNGVERPVNFDLLSLPGENIEVVQSLAKWKRLALKRYGFKPGEGLYTNMNAIRRDEEPDNLHSCYVDQWDWERVISPENRTVDFLKQIVRSIYAAMQRTEYLVCERFPQLTPQLPEEISFIHAETLRQRYPNLSAKEREDEITRQLGAVFIIGIGGKLGDGAPHDMRAPDYDDYSTRSEEGLPGLNGDLLVWNEVLGRSLELSSMGIRVDKEALERQLKESGHEDRRSLYFHQRLLDGSLPLSVGGGIGQSRLCMYYLQKAHIGEIQASIWPEEMRQSCKEMGIPLI